MAQPQWSFGRDRRLLAACREALESLGLTVHFCESDIDHNRTWTSFSGSTEAVGQGLMTLCNLVLPSIDLNRHVGVHPRLGALDLCPLTPLDQPKTKLRNQRLGEWIEGLAQSLASEHEVPVFLYERSERGRAETELFLLRRGGFGGSIERELRPDFGPSRAHPNLGVTFMGLRDLSLAVNVNLQDPDPVSAQRIAHRIRALRAEGDPRMLGVSALGVPLASRGMSQLGLSVRYPDVTPVDPIVEYAAVVADALGTQIAYTELIGVIRDCHLAGATRMHPRPEQVVTMSGDRVAPSRVDRNQP